MRRFSERIAPNLGGSTRIPRIPLAAGAAIIAVAVLSVAAPAAAQSYRIRGFVHDSDRQPVVSARVFFKELEHETVTDPSGRFVVMVSSPRQYAFLVEHISFAARTGVVEMPPGSNIDVDIELRRQPIELPPIVVESRSHRLETVGFFERRARGQGTFLSEEEMLRQKSRSLADVLSQVGGIRRLSGDNDRVAVRGGALISRPCEVQYFLNGVPSDMASGRIASLRATDIEGVEIYRGAGQVPIQFNTGSAMCGAILVWLRHSS